MGFVELTAEFRGIGWQRHRFGRENGVNGRSAAVHLDRQPVECVADYGCDRHPPTPGFAFDFAITLIVEQDLQTMVKHLRIQ